MAFEQVSRKPEFAKGVPLEKQIKDGEQFLIRAKGHLAELETERSVVEASIADAERRAQGDLLPNEFLGLRRWVHPVDQRIGSQNTARVLKLTSKMAEGAEQLRDQCRLLGCRVGEASNRADSQREVEDNPVGQ